jgi:peptidoglycan/xylan/chitin deacetylase (PgdA/CDA1 family)
MGVCVDCQKKSLKRQAIFHSFSKSQVLSMGLGAVVLLLLWLTFLWREPALHQKDFPQIPLPVAVEEPQQNARNQDPNLPFEPVSWTHAGSSLNEAQRVALAAARAPQDLLGLAPRLPKPSAVTAGQLPLLVTKPKPQRIRHSLVTGGEAGEKRRPQAKTPAPAEGPRLSSTSPAVSAFGRGAMRHHITSLSQQQRWITLSFDGDHLDNCTESILTILSDEGVTANFFLTGFFIQHYESSVHDILEQGHEVGNHTLTHPHLTTYETDRRHRTLEGVDFDFIKRELQTPEQAFLALTGKRLAPFWRAPYGEQNREIRQWAYGLGYLHIGWSKGFDSMDWMVNSESRYYKKPKELEEELLAKMKDPGHRIILFHLGSKRVLADRPHLMLKDYIVKAKAMGYEFLTISEALSRTGRQMNDSSDEVALARWRTENKGEPHP